MANHTILEQISELESSIGAAERDVLASSCARDGVDEATNARRADSLIREAVVTAVRTHEDHGLAERFGIEPYDPSREYGPQEAATIVAHTMFGPRQPAKRAEVTGRLAEIGAQRDQDHAIQANFHSGYTGNHPTEVSPEEIVAADQDGEDHRHREALARNFHAGGYSR